MSRIDKKIALVAGICLSVIFVNAFAQKEHKEPTPQNLQVLPKTLSGDEVDNIMHTYTKSLGVRCGHCHAPKKGERGMDFPSDENPTKNIARGMIQMQDSINHMIDMIGNNTLEHITCVTCHRGAMKPLVSLDSLITNHQ
jgi:hypothetical protein